jgi:hypothetical protein
MIFKTGCSQCKTGFCDLQNVALNCCVVQRTTIKFYNEALYRGTAPVTIENMNNSN